MRRPWPRPAHLSGAATTTVARVNLHYAWVASQANRVFMVQLLRLWEKPCRDCRARPPTCLSAARRGRRGGRGHVANVEAAALPFALNIAAWFDVHALLPRVELRHFFLLTLQVPDLARLDRWALLLAVVAAVMLFRFKIGMVTTLGICCAAGIAMYLLGWLT